MLDPIVHGALVVVATWLVNLAFAAIGVDLGNEVATGLAQVIVAYILSLFGLGLVRRVKIRGLIGDEGDNRYKPPFT